MSFRFSPVGYLWFRSRVLTASRVRTANTSTASAEALSSVLPFSVRTGRPKQDSILRTAFLIAQKSRQNHRRSANVMPMYRPILSVPLSVAAVAMCLTAVTATAAGDADCAIILPAADQLESGFNLVSPSGTPPYVASQIRNALAPLHGLRSPAAVDLRIRSDMLASQIDTSDPYRPANPEQLASDLAEARQRLAAARDYCGP